LKAALDILTDEFLKDSKTKLVISENHYANFTAAIRDRSQTLVHEGIGASSVIACHLMNFAYYYGKNFKRNPKANDFADGTGDAKWLHTPYRGDCKI